MKNKYFDRDEFYQILSLTKTNPYQARQRFEEYLIKYPEDYSTYPYYISNLISLREIDKAEETLNYLSTAYIDNKKFNRNKEKLERLKRYILINKIKILSYKGQYEEIYQIYLNNKELIEKLDISNVIFYCKRKLFPNEPINKEGVSYLYKQIIDYQEEEFLNHIQKHTYEHNLLEEDTFENPSTFSKDFPLETIVKEIKKHIPSNKSLFYGFYSNIYVFKYNRCGQCNGHQTNYFKVICFNKTNQIITMFPCIEGNNLPHYDLNYILIEEQKNEPKVRRLSQIDKFNQRYKNINK